MIFINNKDKTAKNKLNKKVSSNDICVANILVVASLTLQFLWAEKWKLVYLLFFTIYLSLS